MRFRTEDEVCGGEGKGKSELVRQAEGRGGMKGGKVGGGEAEGGRGGGRVAEDEQFLKL